MPAKKIQFSLIQFWVAVAVAGKGVQLRMKSLPNVTNTLSSLYQCSLLNPIPLFSDVALELLVI